jgi:hypothetical protein
MFRDNTKYTAGNHFLFDRSIRLRMLYNTAIESYGVKTAHKYSFQVKKKRVTGF